MGISLSRFWRKPSTKEVLKQIQKEINEIVRFKSETQTQQKHVVGSLVVYSSACYVLGTLSAYVYWFPRDFREHLYFITLLLLVPLGIITFKNLLTWHYRRKIDNNERKLIKLRERKGRIIDEVKETETYKVAKEILDEFAPDIAKSPPILNSELRYRSGSSAFPQYSTRPPDYSSRRTTVNTGRNLQSSWDARPALCQTPAGRTNGNTGFNRAMSSSHSTGFVGSNFSLTGSGSYPTLAASPTGRPLLAGASSSLSVSTGREPQIPGRQLLPLPRPIIPQQRSYVDKLVEYLVGDGPSNRYALICRQCESHNGMALKEDFEYLGFRCCYCFFWNQARKQRPQAPKLDSSPGHQSHQTATITAAVSSSSDEDEDDDDPALRESDKVQKNTSLEESLKADETVEMSEPKEVIEMNSSPSSNDEVGDPEEHSKASPNGEEQPPEKELEGGAMGTPDHSSSEASHFENPSPSSLPPTSLQFSESGTSPECPSNSDSTSNEAFTIEQTQDREGDDKSETA